MPLDWARDGPRWPHRDRSTFVQAGGLRWHVQRFGTPGAPVALLLHGTGAATHSWRGLAPLLAEQGFEVLAADLPGHGFTRTQDGVDPARVASLPGMAAAVATLLRALDATPVLLVGHSAGAALAAGLVLDQGLRPRVIASLNGALLPWDGLPGRLFLPLARAIAATPLLPALFSWRASDPRVLAHLLDGTGSTLDPQGEALYRLLVSDRSHVAGALAMMANWELQALAARLPSLPTPMACMVGTGDRTVPPGQADDVQRLLPGHCRLPVVRWPGLGHLAHEERPDLVAASIATSWRTVSAAAAR